MKKPQVEPDLFIDRKGFLSLNVMAVCDDSTQFTYYKVGAYGSAYDSRVLRCSKLIEHVESLPAGLCILGRLVIIHMSLLPLVI